jgi:tetratricopeptide (TPR) repeat protein
MNEYEEAIQNYNKATELDPDYTEAWNYKGMSHYYMKEYENQFRHMINS